MIAIFSPIVAGPFSGRKRQFRWLAGIASASLLTSSLAAQDQTVILADTAQTNNNEPGTGASIDDSQIVVEGQRLRGQLVVEQAPLLELNEQDIAAEGVTSIADLVTQVTTQTGSARGRGGGGRPVILVNGIRIGSFRELSSYPPEALARVEVFPEEVAQRFGFAPDRRVINLILKENYSSREVELEFEGPSRGGYMAIEQELGYLQIADGGRFNVNLEAQDFSILTEAEREVDQTEGSISAVPGDPDQAEFRSLIPDSLSIEGNLSWARALIDSGTSLSANLNYARNQSRSLSGLNSVTLTDALGNSEFRTFGEEDPLERRTSTDTYSLSGSLTRPMGALRLTATVNGVLADSETEIDRRFDTTGLQADALAGLLALDGDLPRNADAGFDVASTRTYVGTSKATLRGAVLELPAGEVQSTIDVGYGWNRIESADTRTNQQTELTRGDLEAGINLSIPLTSTRAGFADALGSFRINFQAGVNELSDFGTLTDWTTGLNWSPFGNLDLSAIYVRRDVAPSLSNLGSPQVSTFNVPVFDFTNGETVLATVVSGGNPNLLAETQSDWRFLANWELPFWQNTRFSAEYIRNRSDNVTSNFPVLTDEIEAAFPNRVLRDGGGALVQVDFRPITFAETRSERLQFSIRTRGTWGSVNRGARGQGGRPPSVGGSRPAAERATSTNLQGQSRQGRRGPPSEERRAQMMQFRERICADDGLATLTQLVRAVESGQDLSTVIPDFNPQRLERLMSRMRAEDGSISDERIATLRERICSMNPASFRGRTANQSGQGQGNQTQTQSNSPAAGQNRRGPPRNPLTSNFGRDGTGRYFFNLTHVIELNNEVLVAPGGPVLDLLDGDATGSFGQARHAVRLEGGVFRNGMGLRVSGRYSGSSRIDGSGLPGSTDLFFGDLATLNLRLFGDVGRLLGKDSGFLQNLRFALRADNVFDTRREVTDSNGDTPINYQPFVIDPTGRFVGIDLRKIF